MPNRRPHTQVRSVVPPLHVFESDPFTIKVSCWPDGAFAALYWTADNRQILDENELDLASMATLVSSARSLVEHVRQGGSYTSWRTGSGLPDLPFEVGRVVVTDAAEHALFDEGMVPARRMLDLHQSCQWGCVDERIRQRNERALIYGGRLQSLHLLPRAGVTVRIVTTDDRSSTTISLQSEYRSRRARLVAGQESRQGGI
jgi:hypothetical protein